MSDGSDEERYGAALRAAGLEMAADLPRLDGFPPDTQAAVLGLLGELAFGPGEEGVRRLAERGVKAAPKDWLLARLDLLLEGQLAQGGYDEYNRIAWVLRSLDRPAYLRHVERCRQHANEEIRELGEDLAKMAGVAG
ncbi:MAG: hypothetical protein JWO82_2420 [Akkermansiaceae bacterium]|nr:hypothetical protein [Akkermansiaceae bacterium]